MLALVAALCLAASAGAAVLDSVIETPNDPTYLAFGSVAPQIPIAGTSGETTGAEFDIRCYSDGGTESKVLATNVPAEADGSFSVTAPAAPLSDSLCRLLAVPAGSEPTPIGLAQLTGPVIATSEDFPEAVASGPNAGLLGGHYFYGQQLDGAFDYYSAGECGLGDGYLFDPVQLEKTTTTFFCNDSLDGSRPTRSALQVDGANSYTATSVPYDDAAGFPAYSYTYDQNPTSGDLTISESDEIVRCSGAEYPPTKASCPSYVDTGVRLEQTIVQSHDGLLSTISDRFISSDGAAHSVDTEPENAQSFSYPNSEQIDYSFPGAETVTSPAPGETVSFDDSAPATVYLSVHEAADGDEETGRGAIVFGEPTSPATFTAKRLYESTFLIHQTAAVPAGGAVTKHFAYAQAYEQAEVEALAHEAEAQFAAEDVPAPNPGGGGNEAPAPASPPSNRIDLLTTKLNKKAGTAQLKVKVPGPGSVMLSGKKVKTFKRTPAGASVVSLKVAAKPHFAATLARAGKLKVSVKIAFAPSGGSAGTVNRSLKLVRK
jgi:hypothetical protein